MCLGEVAWQQAHANICGARWAAGDKVIWLNRNGMSRRGETGEGPNFTTNCSNGVSEGVVEGTFVTALEEVVPEGVELLATGAGLASKLQGETGEAKFALEGDAECIRGYPVGMPKTRHVGEGEAHPRGK